MQGPITVQDVRDINSIEVSTYQEVDIIVKLSPESVLSELCVL